MEKRSPFKAFLKGAAVFFGFFIVIAIFNSIATCCSKNNKPQEPTSQDIKELNEMRVYHSDKGLVDIDSNGYIIITP